jgi:hypothetical protein
MSSERRARRHERKQREQAMMNALVGDPIAVLHDVMNNMHEAINRSPLGGGMPFNLLRDEKMLNPMGGLGDAVLAAGPTDGPTEFELLQPPSLLLGAPSLGMPSGQIMTPASRDGYDAHVTQTISSGDDQNGFTMTVVSG